MQAHSTGGAWKPTEDIPELTEGIPHTNTTVNTARALLVQRIPADPDLRCLTVSWRLAGDTSCEHRTGRWKREM